MMICAVSLIIHPAIVWFSALIPIELKITVITAAMAPGSNTYVFANIYGRGKRVAQQVLPRASQLAQFGFGSFLHK